MKTPPRHGKSNNRSSRKKNLDDSDLDDSVNQTLDAGKQATGVSFMEQEDDVAFHGSQDEAVGCGQGRTEQPKFVVNELLMYASYHLNCATRDNIMKVLAGFFALDEIKKAKTLLWELAGVELLGPQINRQKSQNRTEEMAMCEDILKALQVITEASEDLFNVTFCAVNWKRVPKTQPESYSTLCMSEKIAELEEKVDMLFAKESVTVSKESVTVSDSRAPNVSSQEKINVLESTISKQDNAAQDNREGRTPPAGPSYAGALHQTGDMHNSAGNNSLRSTVGPQGSQTDSEGFRFQRHQNRRNYKNEQRFRQGTDRPNRNGATGARAGIGGSSTTSVLRQTPSPSRDFFISRVHKEDDIDKIKRHFSENNIVLRGIEQKNHTDAVFNSYRVTVSLESVNFVMSAVNWPVGVKVRRWFIRNNDGRNQDISQS